MILVQPNVHKFRGHQKFKRDSPKIIEHSIEQELQQRIFVHVWMFFGHAFLY